MKCESKSPRIRELLGNIFINGSCSSFSNITFSVINISPASCAWRLHFECKGMDISKGRQDLNLNLPRKLTFWDAIPEISSVNLKVSDGHRFRKVLVALTSELCVYFSIRHANRYRKTATYKPKQIAFSSQGDQRAWIRTTCANPCWNLSSNRCPKLNSIANLTKLVYPLRGNLRNWDLSETGNQRIEVTGAMMLEILSHPRHFVLGLNKTVGQQPYGLSSLIRLYSHQLKQALLSLFSRQLKVTNREIASRHNSDDRTNGLNPIRSATPLTRHAPGPGNHANQANKRDSECQKDCTLPEGLSPLRRFVFPFSSFVHSRSPNIPATEMGVSMGAAA